MLKSVLLPFFLTAALLSTASTMIAANDPFVGTWRSSVEKTTAEPKNEAARAHRQMEITPFGSNGLSIVIYGLENAGATIRVRLDFRFDGQHYEQQGPHYIPGETTSAQKIDKSTILFHDWKDKKAEQDVTATVSEDEQHMTIDVVRLNKKEGTPYQTHYDRK